MVAPFALIRPPSVQVMTVPEGVEVDSVVAEVVEDMEAVAVDMEEVVADTTTTLVADTLEVVDIAEVKLPSQVPSSTIARTILTIDNIGGGYSGGGGYNGGGNGGKSHQENFSLPSYKYTNYS